MGFNQYVCELRDACGKEYIEKAWVQRNSIGMVSLLYEKGILHVIYSSSMDEKAVPDEYRGQFWMHISHEGIRVEGFRTKLDDKLQLRERKIQMLLFFHNSVEKDFQSMQKAYMKWHANTKSR